MEKLLEVKNIFKRFGVIKVLENVSFDVNRSEVLALSGENGAGKSTLMKIVAGLYPPNSGQIIFNGVPYEHFNLSYSRERGVSLIYQELSIAPNISVMDNIFMGSEQSSWGFLKKKSMLEKSDEILSKLNADFSSSCKAGSLSIAQQQQIEIARAISHNSELIIMDEPTASLSNKEVQNLFSLITSLKQCGITIIYISHKMDEIREIADRVAILRDGKYIGNSAVEDTDNIIYMMVGRSLESFYADEEHISSDKQKIVNTLKLQNISDESGCVKNISCTLQSGEIIGMSGLIGAGRSELARIIFGADKKSLGNIYFNDKELKCSSPIDAIKAGIGMVPEDRKLQGLFLEMSSLENVVENNQVDNALYQMFINNKKNTKMAKKSIEDFNIKTTLKKKPHELSGGNQQKILLARWLNISPKILIFDEPTRGIDVGAKQEIYKMIRRIAYKGTLVIFISSELPEIIHLSDRVLVMREGELVGDISDKSKMTQENIMRLCAHKGGNINDFSK